MRAWNSRGGRFRLFLADIMNAVCRPHPDVRRRIACTNFLNSHGVSPQLRIPSRDVHHLDLSRHLP